MTTREASAPGLSIVIPAWNEEARLARTLERYVPALESRAEPFELIIVVDGASDRTSAVADRWSSRHVRVLEFSHRLGKGGAILAGFREARYDRVGFTDADGPVPLADVLRVADSLTRVDCAIASRRVNKHLMISPQSLSRRVFSRCWNLLVRGVLFLPISDTQCGVKFVRRSAVRPILDRVSVTNWAFDVALLYHLRSQGSSIQEVAVRWEDSSGSKLRLENAIPRMFVSLLGIRMVNRKVGRHAARNWGQWTTNAPADD